MQLEDGRLYSPEQLSEWEIFGPGVSPESIRKATRRTEKPLPCTKWPLGAKRGRIMFTKANIEAGLAGGLQDAKPDTSSQAPRRRSPLAPVADLPRSSERLTANPQAARRRSRKAS